MIETEGKLDQTEQSQSAPHRSGDDHDDDKWRMPDPKHKVQGFLQRRRDILANEALTSDERRELLHNLIQEFNSDLKGPQAVARRARYPMDSDGNE